MNIDKCLFKLSQEYYSVDINKLSIYYKIIVNETSVKIDISVLSVSKKLTKKKNNNKKCMKMPPAKLLKLWNTPVFLRRYIKKWNKIMPSKLELDISDIKDLSELKNKVFDLSKNLDQAIWISVYEAAKMSGYSRHNINRYADLEVIRRNDSREVLRQDVELLMTLSNTFKHFVKTGLVKEKIHDETGKKIYEYVLTSGQIRGITEKDTQILIGLKKIKSFNKELLMSIIQNV